MALGRTTAWSGIAGLSLLLGTPALASNPFTVTLNQTFGGAYTGSSADFTFNFGGSAGSYTLDLTLANTTSASVLTTSALTGFAFQTPDSLKITNFTYDRNSTSFYQAKDLTIPPAPPFDFCASSDKDGKKAPQCGAGSVKDGIPLGGAAQIVKFTFDSIATDADTVAAAFQTLFAEAKTDQNNPNRVVNSTVRVAARFQNVTLDGKPVGGGSDKVSGGTSGKAPADVPGPLPILGAASAFAYSRKLRSRLKARPAVG